ncbi:MAG: ATP-binding cassette domain-containing protein [Desulfobacterales bacterium]|nr:ATP-binding cassette domain-containing protein [Desulfobacterales bacterium]
MDDVSFAFDEARIVAVIGPNGSGKTTLLKILNATLFPNTGRMLIEGRDTRRLVASGNCPDGGDCSAGVTRDFFIFRGRNCADGTISSFKLLSVLKTRKITGSPMKPWTKRIRCAFAALPFQ